MPGEITKRAAICGCALLFAFWPLAVFWDHLRFDPAKFTEEWIKLTSAGLLISAIVNFAIERRALAEDIARKTQLVKSLIADPAESALRQIHALRSGNPEIQDIRGNSLSSSWRRLSDGIAFIQNPSILNSQADRHLIQALSHFDIIRGSNLVLAMSNSINPIIDHEELDELEGIVLGLLTHLPDLTST